MNTLKINDVIDKIPRLRILNALSNEKRFIFNIVDIKIREIKHNKEFECVASRNGKTLKTESIIPESDKKLIELKHMCHDSKNIYALLITTANKRIYNDKLLIEYEPGPSENATIRLIDKILQEFINFYGFSSVEEIDEYVKDSENISEMKRLLFKKV